jgi:hypothetical protein
MAKVSSCPDVSELQQLAGGNTPPPKLEALVQHL